MRNLFALVGTLIKSHMYLELRTKKQSPILAQNVFVGFALQMTGASRLLETIEFNNYELLRQFSFES